MRLYQGSESRFHHLCRSGSFCHCFTQSTSLGHKALDLSLETSLNQSFSYNNFYNSCLPSKFTLLINFIFFKCCREVRKRLPCPRCPPMRCAVVPAQAGAVHEAPQPSRLPRLPQPAWLQPSIIHTTTGNNIEGVRINL